MARGDTGDHGGRPGSLRHRQIVGAKILASRWVARIVDPKKRERIEGRFHQHGMKFLLVARLLPPLRTGVFIIAGTIHFSLGKFLLADAVYGVVGVGLVFFGGTAIVALIHQVGYWLLAVLGAVIAAGVVYYFYRKRHREKARSK